MLPDSSTLTLFVGVVLALLLVPGPAVLFVVARSVEQGRLAGVVSVLGLGLGGLVHVAAAAGGVSALLAASPGLLWGLRVAGAAYLVYLGVRTLRSEPAAAAASKPTSPSLRRAFRDGVIVQVLNPKAALFLFAFLPQFVDPARGRATTQMATLGLLFVLMAVLCDGAYALLAGTVRRWLRESPRAVRYRTRFAGWSYVTLGVGLLVFVG